MAQASLFPVNIISTVTPASVGVDGADLKWLALGDDGHTYAMKTLADHPALPLTEWVCYQLWQACGLAVPDCAALHQPHHPPAFGSRFEAAARQIPKNPAAFTVAGFFGPHLSTIGALYPLDAFITNHDRHGRNMLIRQGVAGNALVSIDFSRAAMAAGAPFGNPHLLTPVCNTAQWWRYFRDHLAAQANPRALQAAADLPRVTPSAAIMASMRATGLAMFHIVTPCAASGRLFCGWGECSPSITFMLTKQIT